MAPGHAPTYSERRLDPRLDPAEIALEPRDLERTPPERVLRGRVLDTHGDPIPRATLAPQGCDLGGGRMQFGGVPADPLAVTNDEGEFALGVEVAGMKLLLQVDARAYAPRMSPWISAGDSAGDEESTITLLRGATVTGRVERDGKPLAGVPLGLSQTDRNSNSFLGEKTVGTDAEGRFTFVNVAPDDAYSLYGKAAAMQSLGALAVRPLRVGANESTLAAGTLALEQGCRLSGRVLLADAGPAPEGTRVFLDRENAFDGVPATLGPDGRFVIEHAPEELCTFAVRLRNYAPSAKNASYDFLNQGGLIGRVEGAELELLVLLEPAEERHEFRMSSSDPGLFQRYEELQEAPLRGISAEDLPKALRAR